MARPRRDPLATPVAEKILQAALSQFGRSGQSASMKDIAADAGVTPAALYYHYRDKRELLFKGLEWIADSLLTACRPPLDLRKQPDKALGQFVATYVRHQLTQLAPIAPMYTALVHGSRREQNGLTKTQLKKLRELEHELLDILTGILEAGKADGSFRVENGKLTAFAIIGMCEHTLNWVDPKGKMDASNIADYYARLARRMVAPAGQTEMRDNN